MLALVSFSSQCISWMYDLYPDCLLMGLAAQEVFMPTVGILQRLLSVREHAATVARRHDTLRTWEGIAQVLSRKMESERKYIERLEGGCCGGALGSA